MKLSENFKKLFLINLIIFISIVVLDQITKTIVINDLGIGSNRTFIQGLFDLTVIQNTGGAFSIFNQFPFLFQIIGIINVIIFSYLCFCPTVSFNNFIKHGCACILGGTIGNLIDRFLKDGVVDFIELKTFHFAVFNLADVFINIGIVLIIIGWAASRKQQI